MIGLKTGNGVIVRMKMKEVLALIGFAALLCVAVALPSADTKASGEATLMDELRAGTAHIRHEEPMFAQMKDKEVVQAIVDSWDRSEAILRRHWDRELTAENGWQRINSADAGIEFTNFLTQKEAFSFNAAFMGKAHRAALQVGDFWPALLLNKEEGKAVLFWERKDGTAVAVTLLTRQNEDGSRDWYEKGPAEEVAAAP